MPKPPTSVPPSHLYYGANRKPMTIPGSPRPAYNSISHIARESALEHPSFTPSVTRQRLQNNRDITWAELTRPMEKCMQRSTSKRRAKSKAKMQELINALDARKKDLETP